MSGRKLREIQYETYNNRGLREKVETRILSAGEDTKRIGAGGVIAGGGGAPKVGSRDWLETGDIVLFSGEGLLSWAIRRFTKSKWSHIGMVVKIEDWDLCLLWESNDKGEVQDVDSSELKNGVQLVPLSGKIKVYNGEIAFRKLIPPKGEEHLKADLHERLASLRLKYRGVPYEKNLWALIRLANFIKKWFRKLQYKIKGDRTSLFCSELVSLAYIDLGILPNDLPEDNYSPANYGQNKKLRMINGWGFGEEVPLYVEEE